MKAARQEASRAASNRGEIERPAKNPPAERNPRRKVTRGAEVGLVPDTADTASLGLGRGEGSRGSTAGGAAIGEGESVSYGGPPGDGEENRKVSSGYDISKDDGDGKTAGAGGESKRNESVERKSQVERGGQKLESSNQGNGANGSSEYNTGILGLEFGGVKGGLGEGSRKKDGDGGKRGSVESSLESRGMGTGRNGFGESVRERRDLGGSISEMGVKYENEEHVENREGEGKSDRDRKSVV